MTELLDIVALGQEDEALAGGIGLCHRAHDPHHLVGRHAHNFHGVMLILSSPGHVEWHFGAGQEYSGRPSVGDVVICPAFMPTLARWERPFESTSARLSTGLLDRVAERAGLEPGGLRPAAVRRDRETSAGGSFNPEPAATVVAPQTLRRCRSAVAVGSGLNDPPGF